MRTISVRRPVCAFIFLTALLSAPLGRFDRAEAQSPVPPSRPWTCWSVPATGGPFATLSVSDRVCGSFVEDAARIRLAPRSTQATRIVVPSAPSGLTATVSGQTVSLAWTASGSDAATTYVLEAGSASGQTDLANAGTGSSASALIATSVPPGRYFLRVRARTASGTSASSNEVLVAVQAGACAATSDAPSALTASVNGSSVTFAWAAPSSGCTPASYVLEAGSAAGLSNLANFSTGSSATTFSAAAVPSGVYYVRVRSSTSAGVSAVSNEVVVALGACTSAPSAPPVLASSVNGSTVVMTWAASSGSVSSYILEAGTASGLTNVVVSDTGNSATSLTATGVPDATYYVRVRGKNACGTGPASMENLVIVPGSTGSGLLAGATVFSGPYPEPTDVTFTDITGKSATTLAFPGQLQVHFAGISQASAEAAIQAHGGLVLARVPVLGSYLAGVAKGGEAAFVRAMRGVSGVVDVLPNPAGVPATAIRGRASAVVAAATAPGATFLETCGDKHWLGTTNALLANDGVYKNCRDITATADYTDAHQAATAIQAQANENGTKTPTLINLSTYGTTQDPFSSRRSPINGSDYEAYLEDVQKKLRDSWKAYLTAVLNAIGSLKAEYRENFLITISTGNNNMPVGVMLADLRQDNPRVTAILKNNVLLASTTLMKGNYAQNDEDFAICNNEEAANGTSYAAPGCLAIIQKVMASTGATLKVAVQAAKGAVAANPNHQLVLSEAIAKAQVLVSPTPAPTPTPTPPPAGDPVTNILIWLTGCQGSADPLPGWKNCSGRIEMNVNVAVRTGWIQATMRYPVAGSFYVGQLQVTPASIPGRVTVPIRNGYVSQCPSTDPYFTEVDVWDGRSLDPSPSRIALVPVTLSGCQ